MTLQMAFTCTYVTDNLKNKSYQFLKYACVDLCKGHCPPEVKVQSELEN